MRWRCGCDHRCSFRRGRSGGRVGGESRMEIWLSGERERRRVSFGGGGLGGKAPGGEGGRRGGVTVTTW